MSAAKHSTFLDLSVPDITTQIHAMHSRPSSYGGQSDVYIAFWDTPEAYTPVAIKVLRVTGTPDSRILSRLRHEISIWGRLSHPNLQRLLGVCFGHGPLPAMVSEWQQAGDITTFLKRQSRDAGIQDLKYRLLGEVMEAVVYLHDQKIIHGDIKGANVLVSAKCTALLSDFGFSTILSEHSRSASGATAAKGTFRWMAPELFHEQESLATLTTASDIWAIGCLLIEVQSGQLPYHTKRNDHQVIIALSKHELPPRPSGFPAGLWDIVLQCCTIDPAARAPISDVLSRMLILAARMYPSILLASNFVPTPNIQMLRLYLKHCARTHSPMTVDVCTKLVSVTRSSRPFSVESERVVTYLMEGIILLLNVCLESAQQDGAGSIIGSQFDNTISSLHFVLQQCRYRPRYPAAIIRPVAKTLAAAYGTSAAVSYMNCWSSHPLCVMLEGGRAGLPQMIAWSSNGAHVAYATECGLSVRREDSEELSNQNRPTVTAVAVSYDGTWVATRCVDGSLSLWNLGTAHRVEFGHLRSSCWFKDNLVFSIDGTHLLCCSNGNCVRLWHLQPHGPQLRLDCNIGEGTVYHMAFSADSFSCVIVTGHAIEIWDVRTGQRKSSLRNYFLDSRYGVASTPDCRHIAAASDRDVLSVWDVATEQVISQFGLPDGFSPRCLAYSHSGAWLAAGSSSGDICTWDVQAGRPLHPPFPVHRIAVVCLAFTPDDARIISSSMEGEFCISDTNGDWLRWDI